jgi:hypothetical protein
MAVTTCPYAGDALPGGTVGTVVIDDGAARLNGALMLARSRRSVVGGGTPRTAPRETDLSSPHTSTPRHAQCGVRVR